MNKRNATLFDLVIRVVFVAVLFGVWAQNLYAGELPWFALVMVIAGGYLIYDALKSFMDRVE